MTDVIVVGATTELDKPASYSDFGSCISLYAPGDKVLGANNVPQSYGAYDENAPEPYRTWSGTSFSAPLVTGI